MEEGDKKIVENVDFIKWFSELNKDSGSVAGGKGANLAEIFNLKIPVPEGFVVTAQAYDYFIREAGLKNKIEDMVSGIDYEDTKNLNEVTEKIRGLILDAEFPSEMEEEVIESYEHLGENKFEIEKGSALDILNSAVEPAFVAVRSSATTEDLAEASFAGQQDTFVNIKGKESLILHIKKCFASLFTARATYYRNKTGFKTSQASLAVVVQRMVNSEKSGVIFSKDPSYTGENIIMEAVWGLGEGIVSGRISPDHYVISKDLEILETRVEEKKVAIVRDSSGNTGETKLREDRSKHQVLSGHEIKRLASYALQLEEHYGKPQDIEFAIEGEDIFIVQTRPITTMEKRIEKGTSKEVSGEEVLSGLAASPGIASGVVKIIKDLADLHKVKKGDILVTSMTNPDMVVTMQKSSAIVTDEGGLTAHASIVSREMGIPCVVGTKEATTKLQEGEIVTVDGYTGKIYKGKTGEDEKKEIEPVVNATKTKIKVIVDLPSFAERAAKTGLKKVGLTRVEGIIAESGKHPYYFLKQGKIEDYEEVIFKGISGIANYFEEIWVRTSDIRSDEFKNLEGAPQDEEANPMLGMHGIRFGLENPKVLKAELKALKRVSEKGKKIGLLLPQIISVSEVQEVKTILKEIGFNDAKVGVMVETPAAVQLIREFCEEGLDFISFGTNDLTQYILAVDRGNEKVQSLFNEMHPAVLHQLEYVIRVCKRFNVETSICGQAGSRKEMAKFLVNAGIDSISVNADMAREISDYVYELEGNVLKDTDKEPRQYEVKKEEEELKKPVALESVPSIEDVEGKVVEKPKVEGVLPQPSRSEGGGVLSEEREEGKVVKDKEKAVEMIEEEKKEYLDEHPEEKEELVMEEVVSDKEPSEAEKVLDKEENEGKILNDTEEAVDAIEREKKEYEENNSIEDAGEKEVESQELNGSKNEAHNDLATKMGGGDVQVPSSVDEAMKKLDEEKNNPVERVSEVEEAINSLEAENSIEAEPKKDPLGIF